jgi:hypothetical protein
MIAQQRPLTSLKAGLLTVAFGSLRSDSATVPGQPACTFSVVAPSDSPVVVVRATVNSEEAAVKNQEILLGSAKGHLAVRITAITENLLVSSAGTNLLLDDEEK